MSCIVEKTEPTTKSILEIGLILRRKMLCKFTHLNKVPPSNNVSFHTHTHTK